VDVVVSGKITTVWMARWLPRHRLSWRAGGRIVPKQCTWLAVGYSTAVTHGSLHYHSRRSGQPDDILSTTGAAMTSYQPFSNQELKIRWATILDEMYRRVKVARHTVVFVRCVEEGRRVVEVF